MMRIQVNGQPRELPEGGTVEELLERLELDGRLVVVELNRQIVRRNEHADTTLHDGDAVELVHFVGGG